MTEDTTCTTCNGSGAVSDLLICSACMGSGSRDTWNTRPPPVVPERVSLEVCDQCRGTGSIEVITCCPVCEGTGQGAGRS